MNNMAMKRLIIEFGQGVDMHGGDQNNAVLKATKDAIHHCCMAGISEIFEITDRKTQAFIKADIYAPHPEQVDPSVVTVENDAINCTVIWKLKCIMEVRTLKALRLMANQRQR